jgi:hypothetical protein
MLLEAYVRALTVGEFGNRLSVGDIRSLDLVISPGSTSSTAVPALDTFLADRAQTALAKVGLAEYAFWGRVVEIEERLEKGSLHREALLDCGVPVILVTDGLEAFGMWDLDNPANRRPAVGRHIGGLGILHAALVRSPVLIESFVRARVASIGIVDVMATTHTGAVVRSVDEVNGYECQWPLVLSLEVESR